MADGTNRVSWRRILTDLCALAVAAVIVAGLLAARSCARKADGGLTMTLWAVARPGESDKPLLKTTRPTVDLDAQEGPRWPARARAVRYDGWIYIPYRGHFVLALQLRGQAQLNVGQSRPLRARSGPITTEHGHRVHPRRMHKEQRLLDRGWHRLRLQAQLPKGTGSIRLFWLPPGRRGSPEYVEPAMLRPDGPKPKTPGHAGPAPRDRWMGLGLLAVLAILVAFWARNPLRSYLRELRANPTTRIDAATLVALFAVALAVRLWDLGSAGQTWDEDVYFSAGRNQWLNLLAADFRPTSWQWNLEHPPVTRYLVGLGSLFGEHLNNARALSAVVGALVVPVTYLAGRDLFGDRRVGLVAAAVTAALPTLLAHAQVAGHESLSVLLYTLTCYLMVRALLAEDDAPGLLLAAAAIGGLLVGCRLVNLTAWFFIAAIALWIALPRLRKSKPLPVTLLLMPLIAGVIFVAVWPRLWSSPARHLGELLTYWHPDVVQKEFFLGRQIRTSWGYFPLYALVTAPPAVLCGLALFGARLGWHRGRNEAVLALWLLAPLAVTPLVPFHRDGIRYVLPLVVPLALAAAVGAIWLADAMTARWRSGSGPGPTGDARRRWLVAGLAMVALAGPTVYAAHRVHPYYLDYYNALGGGPRAALEQRRFEWSWWGEGMAGSVRYLRRHARPPAVVGMDVPARHTVVLHPDVRTTRPGTRPAPDFLLYAGEGLRGLWDQKSRRWRHPPGYTLVHQEGVDGVPLSRVYRKVRR